MYYFPKYTYASFNDNELIQPGVESVHQLRRYDYFNFTKISRDDKIKFLTDIKDQYTKAYIEDSYDSICYRSIFKEFVIRENIDNSTDVRFYKFSLSDWNESDKNKDKDTRNLRVDIYTNGDKWVHDLSYIIKFGHKDQLLQDVYGLLDSVDKSGKIDIHQLYVLPLFINNDNTDEDTFSFVRVSNWFLNGIFNPRLEKIEKDVYKFDKTHSLYYYLNFIIQSITRFNIMNFYMLYKVEMNENMRIVVDTSNIIESPLNTYIKEHTEPTSDKKVMINVANNLNGIFHIDRKNLYTHNNKRMICINDYRNQVTAHYQGYHVGSKKNGTDHIELRWKEAYIRGNNKKYNIIKERVGLV